MPLTTGGNQRLLIGEPPKFFRHGRRDVPHLIQEFVHQHLVGRRQQTGLHVAQGMGKSLRSSVEIAIGKMCPRTVVMGAGFLWCYLGYKGQVLVQCLRIVVCQGGLCKALIIARIAGEQKHKI